MHSRRTIVIALDGFGAGLLGPYGNSWIDTPALNRLAARSVVCEQAIASSFDPALLLPAVCQAESPLPRSESTDPLSKWFDKSVFVSDDPHFSRSAAIDWFTDAVHVESQPKTAAAEQVEDTELYQWLAHSLEWIDADQHDFLWLQGRGLYGSWDAPLAFRNAFPDDEDPPPPESVSPPDGPAGDAPDPDEQMGHLWSYAGQIQTFDLCLDALLQQIEASSRPTLLILIGTRGYPLAEHGYYGMPPEGYRLYSECVHVPLMLFRSDLDAQSSRLQSLMQPSDLFDLLVNWHRSTDPPAAFEPLFQFDGKAEAERLIAVSHMQNEWAIRTPCWAAHFETVRAEATQADTEPRCRLFLKPDDRWDVNDVADVCPAVVAAFRELQSKLATRRCQLNDIEPIEPILLQRAD